MKTDKQIQQDVMAELNWEPSIVATQIGVEVKAGVVTLTGHVTTYAQKCDAEKAAQRVGGVSAVATEIEVKLMGSSQRNDGDIAASVADVLSWTTYLPKDHVKIVVDKGWVTLSGQVDWEYQRQAAVNAVRYLMGVAGVSDDITLKPQLTVRGIKGDIEAALKRGAKDDADSISVAVDGGDVTLSGTVRSWSDRDIARYSAWGTSGVSNVVDNIRVEY